jgi:hypothetical protein
MFKQIVHPETGELLNTRTPAGLNLLRHYVKLSLTQRGGANLYEPPSGDELENMGMDEDDWHAQQAQPGYYAEDLEDSDPEQADLLAEKYEAISAPVLKKKSSPKKSKKKAKKSSPKKAKKAKAAKKKKKSPCRVNPKTKRCSRKGTKNRGACRVSPKGRCIKHKKK